MLDTVSNEDNWRLRRICFLLSTYSRRKRSKVFQKLSFPRRFLQEFSWLRFPDVSSLKFSLIKWITKRTRRLGVRVVKRNLIAFSSQIHCISGSGNDANWSWTWEIRREIRSVRLAPIYATLVLKAKTKMYQFGRFPFSRSNWGSSCFPLSSLPFQQERVTAAICIG